MLLQTAQYGNGQTPNYDSSPEPESNHPVDKELGAENGDQLFPIASEHRVRGNRFKLHEGFGLFMAESPDREGCSALGLDYRERLQNSRLWRF